MNRFLANEASCIDLVCRTLNRRSPNPELEKNLDFASSKLFVVLVISPDSRDRADVGRVPYSPQSSSLSLYLTESSR